MKDRQARRRERKEAKGDTAAAVAAQVGDEDIKNLVCGVPELEYLGPHLTVVCKRPIVLAWSYLAGAELDELLPADSWGSVRDSVESFEAADRAWQQQHLLIQERRLEKIPKLPDVKWCFKIARCVCGDNLKFAWLHSNFRKVHVFAKSVFWALAAILGRSRWVPFEA